MSIGFHIEFTTTAELRDFLTGGILLVVDLKTQLARIEARLDSQCELLVAIGQKEDVLLMDELLVKQSLTKIDAATSAIATNVTTIGGNIQTLGTTATTISSEVDALETKLAEALANGTGVSQELVDQAAAIGDKADALATAADATSQATAALVPVLQGIASKGIQDPVPVPVPPAIAAAA